MERYLTFAPVENSPDVPRCITCGIEIASYPCENCGHDENGDYANYLPVHRHQFIDND